MPVFEWRDKDMRFTMAAFPLVGAVIGLLCVLWHVLTQWLVFDNLLVSLGILLLPFLITGGIHLDGFCDTTDALASRTPKEKMLVILKDSNVGAFAVIYFVFYLLAFFVLLVVLPKTDAMIACFAVTFVLSRALSGLGVLLIKPHTGSGYAHTFSSSSSRGINVCVLTLVVAAAGFGMAYFGGWTGLAAFCCGLLTLGAFRLTVVRRFGGLSGDLSGWFLQMCEITTLAALVVVAHLLEVLL